MCSGFCIMPMVERLRPTCGRFGGCFMEDCRRPARWLFLHPSLASPAGRCGRGSDQADPHPPDPRPRASPRVSRFIDAPSHLWHFVSQPTHPGRFARRTEFFWVDEVSQVRLVVLLSVVLIAALAV